MAKKPTTENPATRNPGTRPGTPPAQKTESARARVKRLPWDGIQARYEAGASCRQLAEEFGIAPGTVQQRLRARGTRMRTTGLLPVTLKVSDAELRQAYADGATFQQLADRYRVSTALIWRRIHFTPTAQTSADQTGDTDTGAGADSGEGGVRRPVRGGSRQWLPTQRIAEAYTAGEGINGLAQRFGCSPSGIRAALSRAGVTMRPSGGVTRDVSSAEIVRLRDVERLGWPDISARTHLTEEMLRARYQQATGANPKLEWHRRSSRHPDRNPDQLRELNSVIDHREEIVAAYLTGQASAKALGRRYGISDATVRRWAAIDRTR